VKHPRKGSMKASVQHSITTLAAHGWSHRRIARELGINRETVGRYLRLLESKPAIPLSGSVAAGRPSLCAPWREVHKASFCKYSRDDPIAIEMNSDWPGPPSSVVPSNGIISVGPIALRFSHPFFYLAQRCPRDSEHKSLAPT
jgi:hypothetical protein